MARRAQTSQQPHSAELSVEQMQRAIPRLKKRIDILEQLQPEAITSSEDAWSVIEPLNASVDDALTRTFGPDSVEYRRYSAAANLSVPITMSMYEDVSIQEIVESLKRGKEKAIALLQTATSSLEEQLEEAGGSTTPNIAPSRMVPDDTRKVFIVHGHDVGAREAVARFLSQCGFEPVILHEQANQGRTIIEKFEANADVGFAVVLLTPDDETRAPNGETSRRARQNVILELGYFTGRLGRERVCALRSGDVELPSDILGVVWTDFDAHGAWKQGLAKELQAANYPIDWNKVMAG